MKHEWRCFPLWDESDPDDVPDNLDEGDLARLLPVDLARRLIAWSDDYDAQLNWDDPGNTVWDEQRLEELEAQGRVLATDVARALPRTEVLFGGNPGGDQRLQRISP
jgi:hypothetical protein